MPWMNEDEVLGQVSLARRLPVRRTATVFLYDFMCLVNSKSDGWSYWRPPSVAAEKLMTLLRDSGRQEIDYEDFRKAIRPMLAFCTRRKFPRPSLPEDDVDVETKRPGIKDLRSGRYTNTNTNGRDQ